ncbi:hypothetical protein LUU34_01173600 [Aix galericulata]|nr:hypothetical protein LUU34_01173600 [Aix galericulata]
MWPWVLVLQSLLPTGEHQLLLSRGRALLSITPSFPQPSVCCPPACCRPLSPPLSLPSVLVDHEQQLTPATSSSQDAAGRQKDAEPPAQPPPSLAFVTSASLPCGPCLVLASRSPGAALPAPQLWQFHPSAPRTASAGVWGSLGAPPLRLPPFVLQRRDPNPDRPPEPGGVQLHAQRGSSGCARSQESPWGCSSTKTAPPHPRLAEPGAAVLVWSWWHRGQRGLGSAATGRCEGRGLPAGVGVMRSIQRLGAAPQHPATPPQGGHRSQGGPWWVAASRGSLRGTGRGRGPSSSLAAAAGLGELAPAASSWLTWLLQGPGPRAATPSFGQPRFLAWEVPPKLQGPPAARTPPAMGCAVPCP